MHVCVWSTWVLLPNRGRWMVGFGSRRRWTSHGSYPILIWVRRTSGWPWKISPLNGLLKRYPILNMGYTGWSWSRRNSKGQPPMITSTSMNHAIVHGWNRYQFDHVWSLFCGRAMTTPDLSGYVDGGVNLQPAKKCLQQSLCKSKRLGTMGR